MTRIMQGDQEQSCDRLSAGSGRTAGRVLVVAADVNLRGYDHLHRAVAAGEHFRGLPCAMTLVVTIGASRLARAMAASTPMAVPPTPYPEIVAESESQVRELIASVGPDVSIEWRCVAESARDTLKRELAAMPYAHVVVGCSSSRRSRRAARRLARMAESRGFSASVIDADLDQEGVPH